MKGAIAIATKRSSWLVAILAWLALAGSAWAQPITVSPTTLSDGTVGASYSATLTASGTTGPYNFTVTAGSLPAGLSLASNGVLSGTPSSVGTFSFTITATDYSLSGSQAYSVNIAAAPGLTLTPSSLPGGQVGVAYAEVIVASGGMPTYQYSINGGSLPPGLTLANDGHLSGTPSTPGSYTFTAWAEDTYQSTGSQVYKITVIEAVPVAVADDVTTPARQPLSIGVTGNDSGTIDSITLVSNPSHGSATVSGLTVQYQSSGNFVGDDGFTYTVSGPGGTSSAATVVVHVAAPPPLTMEPATLADGVVGTAYYETIIASGGSAPYLLSIPGGGLPPGLTLASDGHLSGTPSTPGSYAFTVRGEDVYQSSGTQTYNITVIVAVPVAVADDVTTPARQPLSIGVTGNDSGTIDSITLVSNPSHGSATVSGLTVQYQSSGNFVGDDGFTYTVSGPGGTSSAATVVVHVAAPPPLTMEPSTLPNGIAGIAYSETIVGCGCDGPYVFSLLAGALPPGLGLNSDGGLSGTPSTPGSYAFTVRGEDVYQSSGTQTYNITVVEAVPVAVADDVATPARQPLSIAVTGNDSGTIDSITLVSNPSHGSATVSGRTVQYQSSGNFVGDDGFTYSVSGPGGTSAPATVVVHVAALPAPIGVPQAVTTLAGVAVAIHAADGASGLPITGITVVDAPSTGTLVVDGTDLVYTPPVDATGTVGIGYTLSNAYGSSAPVRSTVSVNPIPRVASLRATTPMGIAVDVDLTQGASGGPFTAADVLSVAPQAAGNTSIVATGGGGYRLSFTPASGFVGAASVVFTVTNAHATSAPTTVEITVTARPNPTVDREVGGLVAAQVAVVRDFASAQIANVQDRLETLHEPGSRPWGFWVGGSVRHGDRDATANSESLDFETSGMSGGADYRFSERIAIGGGFGYGRDRTSIGGNGSRSDARAASGVGYASFHPSLPWFIDMIGGHQRITFQLRRFVAATGATVDSPRDGTQDFSSWSSGYQRKGKDEAWGFSSYARMDISKAKLDAYDESGAPLQSLSFDQQQIETRTSTVGARARFKRAFAWGTIEPRLKLEVQRDFHDQSGAAIGYADTPSGPAYVMEGNALDRTRVVYELGTVFKTKRGYLVRVDYRGVQGGLNNHDNSLVFSFQDKH